MSELLKRLRRVLSAKPPSAEDVAAEAEAKHAADRALDVRLSQRSGSAGENYQSGRATR
jgi:hypothetical protein